MVTVINGAGIDVTATITNDANGRANVLTLTSSNGNITLADGTSNFLTATKLIGASGTTTLSSTSAFTKQMSLNDVIADINGAGLGITASLTNDTNGRPTIVTLTSGSSITLGNQNDTSTILKAANLLASPGGNTRSSTAPVSRISLTDTLANASMLEGAPASGAHTLSINGTSISYNTATDSLSDVLSRISSSAAGVTARYDPATDSVSLQQTKTGSMPITLADDGSGGNLLSELGLVGASQTTGVNASYQINGGAAVLASDNTVDLGNGIVLTLASLTTVGSPVTVTVNQNASGAISQVRSFVSAYNGVMTTIASQTKSDGSTTNNTSGPLSGDAGLRMLAENLRSAVTSAAINPKGTLKSLSDLGLSFGAVGSAVGTTNTLQFDATKFSAALANDPVGAQSVLSAFTLVGTLAPGGTSSVASLTGTYAGSTPGVYRLVDDGAGNLKATFVPASGGPAETQSVVIAPNGTNTSLIPGMTLTVGGALTAGTSTVTVSASSQGVGQSIKRLVDVQVGNGGVLQSRQNTYTTSIADIAKQHDRVQAQIDAEMEVWRKKFDAMETAQAKLQQVQNSVTQMVNQLAANSGSSSSSKSG
jgi:flagellar hook-associated protein 2